MKFDDVYQTLLETAKKKPSEKLPYKTESNGNVIWTREGGNLEGAPKEVGRGFYCSSNQLKSLEGAPKEVGGNFYCHTNHLKSLKGAPEKVGGNFNCHTNHLKSLEGAPKEVGGNFNCYNNQLKSLEGAPEKVGGEFDCNPNPLKSLKGIPEADSYDLPDGFAEKDARKEVERRKFRKELDKETVETWGDFVDQL